MLFPVLLIDYSKLLFFSELVEKTEVRLAEMGQENLNQL
jgi:hypothetical protein